MSSEAEAVQSSECHALKHILQGPFKNGPNAASFCIFSFFSNIIALSLLFNGIRTQIVEVEGEYDDHCFICQGLP